MTDNRPIPSGLQAARVLQGLKRAAKQALKLAQETNTPCYVLEEGKIVDLALQIPARSSKRQRAPRE